MLDQSLQTIVSLAHEGGSLAVWLYLIPAVTGLVKYVIAAICILVGVSKLCVAVKKS